VDTTPVERDGGGLTVAAFRREGEFSKGVEEEAGDLVAAKGEVVGVMEMRGDSEGVNVCVPEGEGVFTPSNREGVTLAVGGKFEKVN